jgi:hypothetical protein
LLKRAHFLEAPLALKAHLEEHYRTAEAVPPDAAQELRDHDLAGCTGGSASASRP